MFLALDESLEGNIKVMGCLILPVEDLPDFESKFTALRIKHKLWAEIKWDRVDRYYGRYCDFLDLINEPSISFHSFSFPQPTIEEVKKHFRGDANTVLYRYGYSLVRTIAWKIVKAGLSKELYIVPDSSGSLGQTQWKTANSYLQKDARLPGFAIAFCSQGTSHIVGALQVCDVITGAVGAVRNGRTLNPEQKAIVDYLVKLNGGWPLDYTHPTMPDIGKFKINHFAVPDNR